MAYKNNISYILRQRFTTEFCVKLGKMGEKCMYGTETKAKLQFFVGGTVLQTEIKGLLTSREEGDQAVLLQM
jgi:hypothetical protein